MHQSKVTTRTVETIVCQVKMAKTINLTPVFQRDIVWDEEKQSAYINSIYNGYDSCSVIVFNKTSKETICVDGKQRITSMIKFLENKIPVEINGKYYFYKSIPKSCDYQAEILSDNTRFHIESSAIHITEFENLSHTEMIDLFNRVQHGVKLSSGDKILSVANNVSVATALKEACESIKYIFSRFSKLSNNNSYRSFIINSMYCISNNTLKIISNKEKHMFINSFLDNNKFLDSFNNAKDTLMYLFGDDILGNSRIKPEKYYKNYLISLVYFFHNNILISNNIDNNTCRELRNVIRRTWNEIKNNKKIGTKNTNTVLIRIDKLLCIKLDNSSVKSIFIKSSATDFETDDSDTYYSEDTDEEEIIEPAKTKLSKKKKRKINVNNNFLISSNNLIYS